MKKQVEKQLQTEKGGIKLLVAILIILILIASVLLGMKVWQDRQKIGEVANQNTNTQNIETTPIEKQEPKTFAGEERPIAFMIDNNINAMPQAGLVEADLIYEIIVEGGETRLMAVMKNKDLEKIGPLRSARHYFLDYALENDAIYVHYGQSPQASSDITTLGINNINGMYESGSLFWRVSDKYAPHNAVTSMEQIQKIIKREEYRTTSSKGTVLNYVAEEIELEAQIEKNSNQTTNNKTANQTTNSENTNTTQENTENLVTTQAEEKIINLANTVTIPYSYNNTVKYTYDEETKTYIRYSRDKKQVDWNTEQTIAVKNIIITKCENTTIDDGSSSGRQTLDNIKTLDGYYITNGKYIPIKCEKTSRSGKTIYKDLEGNEIKVNDGKTFIQICPIDSEISFE